MSRNHTIVIVRPLDPNGGEVIVQARKIKEFSRRLHREVEEDRRHQREITRIEPTNPISAPALLAIVKVINGGTPKATTSRFKELKELLELSRALWEYECAINPFRSVARLTRDRLWPEDCRRGNNCEGWAFIALVFGWRDVFEEASAEILREGYADPNTLETGLPEGLISTSNREEQACRTVTFVRDSCFELLKTDQASFNRIAVSLNGSKIDVCSSVDSMSRDIGSTPGAFLRKFVDVLHEIPNEGQPLERLNNLEDSSSQTNSSSSGTGDSAISIGQVDPYFSNRGGVFADISWRQMLKPKPKQSPVEVWNSVAVDSWRRSTADILKKVDDFRKTGFRIMKVEDFESVRGSHLIIIHEDIIAAA